MTKKLHSEKELLEKSKLNSNEPRNVKSILLAKEIQNALLFSREENSSEEEYESVLVDELTNDYDDSHAILLDVQWSPSERYESTRVKTI
ncbi:hypothetical protein C2F74_RS20825 [Vibrio parahaemolyticus]|nr:hypothetical protein [Vibrio parahaemolyticus]